MSSKTEKATATAIVGIKIHELAKEMGVASKALIEKATELGIKVKSHASVLSPGQADRLRAKLGGSKKLKADLEESKTRLSKRKTAVKAGGGAAAPGTQERAGGRGGLGPPSRSPGQPRRRTGSHRAAASRGRSSRG